MIAENPFTEIDKRLSNIETLLADLKHPEQHPEPSDRCGLETACEILGTKEHPVSKAWVYKKTHLKILPHSKYGRTLIFSRRQLTAWREEHTLSPSSPEAEMNQKLTDSAKKHLRNE